MIVGELAGVASYLPSGRVAGVPRAGWDEDAFTLAVAAFERLAGTGTGPETPARVLLLGPFPSSTEANLVRFFGSPVAIERTGTGAAGLEAAARALERASPASADVLLLAAEVVADRPDTVRPDGADDPDGAVAAWVGAPTGSPASFGLSSSSGSSPIRPFRELRGSLPPGERGRWVGDWDVPVSTSAAASGALRTRTTLVGPGPVSQGAYVPLARYEENLPSRWRFAADSCAACGAISFPVRSRCRKCGRSEGLSRTYLPRDGGLVMATTTIGSGGQPTEFDEQVSAGGPYEVALVELVPEVRVTLQATDVTPGQLRIGDRVGTSLRRLYPMEGEWRYGRKALRAPQRSG
jgi:uncharacterized OB-fold protein